MRPLVANSPRVLALRMLIGCLALAFGSLYFIALPLARIGDSYGQPWLFVTGGLIVCVGFTDIFVKCVWWSRHIPRQMKFAEMSIEQVQNESAGDYPLPPPDGGMPTQRPLLLDYRKFERQTAELLEIGYGLVREGQLKTRPDKFLIFARLFFHPEGSLALLIQSGTVTGMGDVHCSIFSEFGGGWVWSNSNIQRNVILEMMRLPRFIGRTHSMEVPVSELRNAHLDDRSRLVRELGVQISALDPMKYDEWSRRLVMLRRKRFIRCSLWIFILKKLFSSDDSDCWWGEYKKYARTVAAQ